MKVIIDKSRIKENAKLEEERKMKDVQRKLQEIEDAFAKEYGFDSRVVVYAPFDRAFNRELMIDYLTEQYYPLNLDMGLTIEEFRVAIIEQMGAVIEEQIDAMEHTISGYFKKQLPDKVYLFSNTIKHDMLVAVNVLKHETLHAGIFDLMRGKIPKLKMYKNSRYDDEFFRNLVIEHQMRPLVNNRNNMVLKEVGIPDRIFQFYSYEEEFVMFNTACSMLEQELQKNNLNADNIYNIISVYLGSSGVQFKPMLDDVPIDVYGKRVPLKDYLKTYFEHLRGSVENYDEKDKSIAGVLETFETKDVCFEDNGSKIPELVDELSKYVLSKKSDKLEILKIVRNFCDKYKTGPNFS